MGDVSHRKCGLRFEKKQLVEFLPPDGRVDIQSWVLASEEDGLTFGARRDQTSSLRLGPARGGGGGGGGVGQMEKSA